MGTSKSEKRLLKKLLGKKVRVRTKIIYSSKDAVITSDVIGTFIGYDRMAGVLLKDVTYIMYDIVSKKIVQELKMNYYIVHWTVLEAMEPLEEFEWELKKDDSDKE